VSLATGYRLQLNMSTLQVPGSATAPALRPKLAASKTTANRLPPPALFQGPPSHNASNISLGVTGASAAVAGSPTMVSSSHGLSQQPQRAPHFSKISESTGLFMSNVIKAEQGEAKNENDRADALWAEMQNTLAGVELSASRGSHVFSEQHAKALEDLRTTQLALAQAWAKSEADEMDHHYPEDTQMDIGALGTVGVQASPSQRGKDKDSQNNSRERYTEDETEKDIILARKRREANERYFQQVNSGVLNIVAKLEEVASAMRQVEKESKEIWSEGESSGSATGSATEATEATDSPLMSR
jgi:septum formation topological specificity factor MinE